jgi:hypothetical protein
MMAVIRLLDVGILKLTVMMRMNVPLIVAMKKVVVNMNL